MMEKQSADRDRSTQSPAPSNNPNAPINSIVPTGQYGRRDRSESEVGVRPSPLTHDGSHFFSTLVLCPLC